MLGMHRSPASWFGRRAVRGPASRQRHQRPRRMLTVEALEGRALLSTFTVNSLGDTGTGSGLSGDLRYVITQADQTQGDNTINFAVAGTITLNSALPDLSNTTGVTDIEGPGASSLTVARSSAAGTPDFGVFTVDANVQAKLVGLTITGGETFRGGGIANGGTLTVINSTIAGNSADSSDGGGGISNEGTMTAINSTVDDNSDANGGGIANGDLSSVHPTGTLTLTNCTIAYNSALRGAGIYNGATMTVTNSTIAFNSATGGGDFIVGGGIASVGTLTVTNSTIAYNNAEEGGGLIVDFGRSTLNNTIVALNTNGTGSGAPADDIAVADGGAVLLGQRL